MSIQSIQQSNGTTVVTKSDGSIWVNGKNINSGELNAYGKTISVLSRAAYVVVGFLLGVIFMVNQ